MSKKSSYNQRISATFAAIKECQIFYFGGNTFVKKRNNGASNAFNLDTGEPHYFYADTVVEY